MDFPEFPSLTIEQWACALSSLFVAFVVGWLWGRRANMTAPLNRIAKNSAIIARHITKGPEA